METVWGDQEGKHRKDLTSLPPCADHAISSIAGIQQNCIEVEQVNVNLGTFSTSRIWKYTLPVRAAGSAFDSWSLQGEIPWKCQPSYIPEYLPVCQQTERPCLEIFLHAQACRAEAQAKDEEEKLKFHKFLLNFFSHIQACFAQFEDNRSYLFFSSPSLQPLTNSNQYWKWPEADVSFLRIPSWNLFTSPQNWFNYRKGCLDRKQKCLTS